MVGELRVKNRRDRILNLPELGILLTSLPEANMKRNALVLALSLAILTVWNPLVAAESSGTEPTQVFLVRHAEKQAPEVSEEPRNPELTEAGHARAATLAHVLGETGLDVVLSTPFHRTEQTAAPIARAVGTEVVITPIAADFAEALAKRIRADHAGQRVLVVGHSNTTPSVIRALGVAEAEVPEISEDEYDDLFLVTLPPEGGAWLTTLRYGTESP